LKVILLLIVTLPQTQCRSEYKLMVEEVSKEEEERYWHWQSKLWQKIFFSARMNFISSFVFHHKMHLHVFIALLFILLTGGTENIYSLLKIF